MKKKLLSLVMAVAMVLSLAVPAFATDYWSFASTQDDKNVQSVKFEAKTFVPTIKLTLPNITADPMVLNPYKIEYSDTTNDTLNAQTVFTGDQTSQVICPQYAIKNETNAKMNVKVSTTTTVTGEVTLATTHVDLNETAKKAFLQLVVQKVSTNSAPSVDNAAAIEKLDAYDTANNTVVKLAATTSAEPAAVMANAGTTPNYLVFQFDGELSRSPATAWKANDKITSTVTFTFSPVSATDAVADVASTVFSSNISKDDQTDGKEIELPILKNDGTIDNKKLNNFAVSPTGANFTLTLGSDAKWSLVDGGALGVTVAGSASGYTATVPAAGLNKLPKDGVAHDYTFVLGFADKNGVPRTAEITATITRAS